MKILYFVNDLIYFKAHRENIALDVASQGHDVIVAAGDWESVDISHWPSNMTLVPLDVDKHNLNSLSDFRLIKTVRRIIREKKPDIVHAITIKPILFSALILRCFMPSDFRSNTKLIWTFAGLGKVFETSLNWVKKLRRFCVVHSLRACGGKLNIIATFENEQDQDTLVELSVISKSNSHVLPGTGVSFDHFKPDRAKKHVNGTGLVFLMATRLIHEKGVDTFIEAAAAFNLHPDKPRFILAGRADPTNPDVIDYSVIEDAVSAGNIEFLEAVTQEDMPALYSSADVFCLPTRLREGFPKSLLEAAACGCALLASDQKIIRRIVISGQTGWLLSQATKEELIKQIEVALSQRKNVDKMGLRARSNVLSLGVAEKNVINDLNKLYFSQEFQ